MLTGVLVAYGAFALLISVVAAFANGAHSHQVLSAATWNMKAPIMLAKPRNHTGRRST